MTMTLSAIAELLNGQLHGQNLEVGTFSIDTRTLQPGDVYIAIRGARFDGHDFITQAIQSGAGAIIAETPYLSALPCICVADTRQALAALATAWRKQADAKIVGITGSNGKTTVKEMTAAILGVNAPVLFTRGNLNNDIGVPLTLFRLQEQHRYAVIEMGANHPGEIAYTSRCAQADVVIITNAGAAHLEGFGNIQGVAETKGEIIETLKQNGIAILNRDDDFYDYWHAVAGNRKTLSFGLTPAADISAKAISSGITDNRFYTVFELTTTSASIPIKLSLAGRHNVLNALAASAAAVALGISPEQIQQGLATLRPITGRLQPLVSKQGNIIIDDTYNANPASLKAGLDVLLACHGEPWLVLGAFGELGPDSLKLHAEMGELIKQMGVVRVFATGADTQATVAAFGENARYFESQSDLITALEQQLPANATLLIKGSRVRKMENVAAACVMISGNNQC